MASAGNAEHAAAQAGHSAAMDPDFGAIFEALPGSFLVLSPDLVILAASAAYRRDSRATRDALIGRPILEVFPDRPDPGGLVTLRASLDRVRASHEQDTIAVRRYDLGPLGAEPDTRYWSLANVPVMGTAGRLDYIIHWLDDVTDLVGRAGEQDWTIPPPGGAGARTVAALLARTRELQEANRALELANQALHDAFDAKREFVDRLSHELRTPLNTMLGFGELLSMDDVSARHREWITMTLQAGRQLVGLLDEVGDAARIEARTLSLSLGAVRLDTVIADVLQLVRPLAMSCGVRLAPAPPPDGTAFVRADEQRLRQVLLNLLDNAVKYNHPAGSVEVTVARQPGDRFRICVTDTGRGIEAQDLDPMFQPFERLDAAQAGVAGTGLGLALSRDLTEAMGGSAGVSSTPGEGSTFWIELPATEPMAVAQLAIQRDEIVRSRAYSAPKTVLYVEDMVENLRLVEQILSQRPSVSVLAAMLGGVALDLASQHRPDVILLDLNLPDMTGEAVLAELRASTATCDIPVVILSADATQQRADQARAEGIQAYLTKPIDVQGLLQALDTILAEAPGPADAAAAEPAEDAAMAWRAVPPSQPAQ
jgi:signal transduction histidine kinase/ActR/RegA family two-component response regulator